MSAASATTTPAPALERAVVPFAADWSRAEARAATIPASDVREIRVLCDGRLAEIYHEVRSRSRHDLWHAVRYESGGISCDCEAGRHGRPCVHGAAIQPRCLTCGTDRSVVDGDYCAGCAHVIAGRAPAAPIPFPSPRLAGALRASIADARQAARDRDALADAAYYGRPLGR